MLGTDTSGWEETSNNYLIFIADIFLHATLGIKEMLTKHCLVLVGTMPEKHMTGHQGDVNKALFGSCRNDA